MTKFHFKIHVYTGRRGAGVPPQKNFNIKVPNMHFLASGNKIQGLTLGEKGVFVLNKQLVVFKVFKVFKAP